MNVLLNTPLLKTNTLKHNFDNKIIIIFVLLIYVALILGLLFIDITRTLSNPTPNENGQPLNNSQITIST